MGLGQSLSRSGLGRAQKCGGIGFSRGGVDDEKTVMGRPNRTATAASKRGTATEGTEDETAVAPPIYATVIFTGSLLAVKQPGFVVPVS